MDTSLIRTPLLYRHVSYVDPSLLRIVSNLDKKRIPIYLSLWIRSYIQLEALVNGVRHPYRSVNS